MVRLLILVTALVGHVSAAHSGWVGQYVKFGSSDCRKLQQYADRNQQLSYTNLFDDRGKHEGDGFYNPNFVADGQTSGLNLRKFANEVGGSEIVASNSPRCHGIKFSSRVGYNYDPLSQLDTEVFYQYFCWNKKHGFSQVAFQSGKLVSAVEQDDGRYCNKFRLINTESVVVYTFSSVSEGYYSFSFQSDTEARQSDDVYFGTERNDEIKHLFRAILGHFAIEKTSPTYANHFSVSIGLGGIVDSAKVGEISIKSAKCRNSPAVSWCDNCKHMVNAEVRDPYLGEDDYLYKVMDGCGTKIRPDTVRPYTSLYSSTAICKTPEGTCTHPVKGTVNFSGAKKVCASFDGSLPDGTDEWFTDDCCDALAEEDDWGYDWMYAWTELADKVRNWRKVNVEINDAMARWSSTAEQNAMPVHIVDANGGKFTKDVFVGYPLELEFRYERKCAVLEVAFEFRSSHNQEKIEDVKQWSIYQQPGFHITYWPFPVDWSNQELDNVEYSSQKMMRFNHPEVEAISAFLPFHSINFIADDYQTPNFGFPDMVRRQHYHVGIRASVMVPDNRHCVFSVKVSSGKVWLLFNGEFLINMNGQPPDSPLYQIKSVSLREGVYYYFDLVYVHYGKPFGSQHTQLSLIWSCTDEGGRTWTEVVPRRHLYNHGSSSGTDQTIITNKDHITISSSSYDTFSLSLDHQPTDDMVVQCTAPDGLSLSPSATTFTNSDWSSWVEFTVFERANFGDYENDGPDTAIRCFSGDHELSIYYTRTVNPGMKLFLAAAGVFFSIKHHSQKWLTKTKGVTNHDPDQGQLFTRILTYSNPNTFSCNIQAMHDHVNAKLSLNPVIGFAINFGKVVFALYPSVTSVGWNPYHLESLSNIPTEQHLKINVVNNGPLSGTVQIEAADGTKCEINPVADRFMDISCDIPGYMINDPGFELFDDLEADAVPLAENLFHYPNQAQNIVFSKVIPEWAPTNLPQDIVSTSVIPTPTNSENLDLNWVDFEPFSDWEPLADWEKHFSEKVNHFEVSEFLNEAKDFSSRSVWTSVQISGECPLLDGMYPSLFSLYLNFGFGGGSSVYNDADMPTSAFSFYYHCSVSMYFSKLLSCLSDNYYFNQNDARASIRNMLFHSTTFWMNINDMLPSNLVQSYENGKPGHFCGMDGYLIGTPPICACIGNGRYPDCDSTVTCESPNQQQLTTMHSASFIAPTDDALFCENEKSLVIDQATGNGMYCDHGFCTYWANIATQRGLPLGINPCETPYCITAVTNVGDDRVWWGITECGNTVTSSNNGQNWSMNSHFDESRCDTDADCGKNISDDEQSDVVHGQTWSWSNKQICITDDSTGKPIKYCVKWLCDCLDAEVWSNLI